MIVVKPLEFFVLFCGSVCAAVGQLLLKLGANGRTAIFDFVNWQVFFGLAIYGLGTLCWLYALSRLPLTIVYVFTALTFVLIYLIGIFYLGEPARPLALLGVTLVIAGLYCVVRV